MSALNVLLVEQCEWIKYLMLVTWPVFHVLMWPYFASAAAWLLHHSLMAVCISELSLMTYPSSVNLRSVEIIQQSSFDEEKK